MKKKVVLIWVTVFIIVFLFWPSKFISYRVCEQSIDADCSNNETYKLFGGYRYAAIEQVIPGGGEEEVFNPAVAFFGSAVIGSLLILLVSKLRLKNMTK